MNRSLDALQPYPFERLRALFDGITPNPMLAPISLSIGEPKHATPEFIKQSLRDHLSALASYPATIGAPSLREAIAQWLQRRHALPTINASQQVLPVNGSREALFAFAQTVIDRTQAPLVLCPNPFYQIYEGAALLAGAEPYYVNAVASTQFRIDYASVAPEVWKRIQLVYACSPANPTGKVMPMSDWEQLFELSDRYGFVIAADECYSEIYFDEARPPLGALAAAVQCGRIDYTRLVIFSSLSKRSNVPGMRSGFVAGDADLLSQFLLYRTYHGSAMNPAVQAASAAAWRDESHVLENRQLYAQKFNAALPLLRTAFDVTVPEGGFYFWLRTPIADTLFAKRLYRDFNVAVLPGSYLARTVHDINPGERYIRIALVATLNECLEGVRRIVECALTL